MKAINRKTINRFIKENNDALPHIQKENLKELIRVHWIDQKLSELPTYKEIGKIWL